MSRGHTIEKEISFRHGMQISPRIQAWITLQTCANNADPTPIWWEVFHEPVSTWCVLVVNNASELHLSVDLTRDFSCMCYQSKLKGSGQGRIRKPEKCTKKVSLVNDIAWWRACLVIKPSCMCQKLRLATKAWRTPHGARMVFNCAWGATDLRQRALSCYSSNQHNVMSWRVQI